METSPPGASEQATKKRLLSPKPGVQSLDGLRSEFKIVSEHMREAFALWELWQIAARDQALLTRLNKSIAAHAFMQVRLSLHRSLVLALSRMWDKDLRSLSIPRMVSQISTEPLRTEIIQERVRAHDNVEQLRLIDPNLTDGELASLSESQKSDALHAAAEAAEGIASLDELANRVANEPFTESLTTLRNKRIAHHDLGVLQVARPAKIGDEKVLLNATADIVNRLGGLLNIDPNFDPMREVYRRSAQLFWRPVRAETPMERSEIISADNS